MILFLKPEAGALFFRVSKNTVGETTGHRAQETTLERAPDKVCLRTALKTTFEERAINPGAFRILASADLNAENRNLSLLESYSILQREPNFRPVVESWSSDLKRPGSKFKYPSEIDSDAERESDQPREDVDIHAAFEHSKAQRLAIEERLRQGNLNLARKFTDQLVRHQLANNGNPKFAAMSLCALAQVAKYYHLHSLQLEWAQRAADVCPADPWAHGQAADALIQFSRLDEALEQIRIGESLGDEEFSATTRARILRIQGHLDEALAAYRKIRADFSSRETELHAWSGAAETLRDMWKFEEALEEYQQGLARFPEERFLLCGRAAVLTELGRLGDALAAYRIPELRGDLVAMNGAAVVLREQGNLREAEEHNQRHDLIIPVRPCRKMQLC